jgi:hypothetical protein
VERAVANGEGVAQSRKTDCSPIDESNAKGLTPKQLWATHPDEERRFSEYRFADEGSIVSLILDLNDHLGIGTEASTAVDALQQFKVNCEADSVDIRVRLQRQDGKIWQFQLFLQPLVWEIIPEDTVPRLKGREGKRRLEVKLFKLDKQQKWLGDLVKSSTKPKPGADAEKSKTREPQKGSQWNPLSADELANLPRPSGSNADNRPSSWQPGPVLLSREESKKPSVPKEEPKNRVGTPPVEKIEAKSDEKRFLALPQWVAHVEERQPVDGDVEFHVRLSEAVGETVMEDLELEGDVQGGLRICLRSFPNSPLEIAAPPEADAGNVRARWRRKTRTLELRLPLS